MSWFRKSSPNRERKAAAPLGVTALPLRDGRLVKYLDSRFTPGGEMGAMDILESTRWAAVLRTSEGHHTPWVEGHTCGWAETLEEASEQLRERLEQRARFNQ